MTYRAGCQQPVAATGSRRSGEPWVHHLECDDVTRVRRKVHAAFHPNVIRTLTNPALPQEQSTSPVSVAVPIGAALPPYR